jgi:hypothetical protein
VEADQLIDTTGLQVVAHDVVDHPGKPLADHRAAF